MARGDVRPTASRSYGRSSYSSHREYDDEGRSGSKSVWEWFSEGWERAEFKRDWLFSISDDNCYRLVRHSTSRFGIEDILVYHSPDADSRAKRLIKDKIKVGGDTTWLEWHAFVCAGYEREKKAQEERSEARDKGMRGRWAEESRQREAAALIVKLDDIAQVHQDIDATAGVIRSDFSEAMRSKEVYGQVVGDFIDDVVGCYISGDGFGDEIRERAGIKLQVTVSLDLSNSMYYNGITVPAANAFRTICATLEQLKRELEGNLFAAYFTFSEDLWSNGNGKGKQVRDMKFGEGDEFNNFNNYRPSEVKGWYGHGPYDGTDTFITPLFEKIEKWETEESDPGAIKLDIILTDAVLEHASDIREATVVMERRDGALQAIMLNFMPEEQWHDTTLPRRCVQYHANKDNIDGMLRNLLSEFVAIQL